MPKNKQKGCSFCGSTEGRLIFPREMTFGTRKSYCYLQCDGCGALSCQDEVPIEEAYPRDYFSFQKQKVREDFLASLKSILRRMKTGLLIGPYGAVWKRIPLLRSEHYLFPWFRLAKINKTSSIMDIGCGTGGLLLYLKDCGFKNLTGIDPYIQTDIHYENGLSIQKKGLGEVGEKYDFLIFHHVIEHTSDPLDTVSKAGNILKKDGHILIISPVADCYAFRKYGEHWASLDAPRHLAIPTQKSLQLMAEKTSLRIMERGYVSSDRQLWNSELFLADISIAEATVGKFKESNLDSKDRRNDLINEAQRLDDRHEGDTAVFLLKRS